MNKLVLICSLACALLPGAAWARQDVAQERLRKLVENSDGPREAVLLQLRAMQDKLAPDASPALRRQLLQAIRDTQVDAGRLDEATKVNGELEQLSRAAGDQDGVHEAQIFMAGMMIKQNRLDEVRNMLDRIARETGPAAPPLVRLRLLTEYGRLFNATGELDKAVQHLLDGLALARKLPRRSLQESQTILAQLSQTYTNMKDNARSLATANEALALPVEHPEPRLMAGLYYAKGMTLQELKRDKEAWASFGSALAISRKAGLSVMEAFVLSIMADADLRAERFVSAERTAREALEVATRIGDESAMVFARANIGFALGGQGKIAQALPWIDGVIEHFRKSGAQRDLQALLDEKGRLLERAGLYKDALGVVRSEIKLERELFNSERALAVSAMQEKFEAEQKRRQIELLQRDNRLKDIDISNRGLRQLATSLVALITVLVGVFLFVLYRRAGKSNSVLRELNAKLAYHAVHDPLTGLYNRRSFVERMQQRSSNAVERRGDGQGTGACLILLDIDYFKAVNDKWGHAAGDTVLVEIARRLRGALRESDMLLRWGGEEFLVYSPGAAHEQVLGLVERILADVGSSPVPLGDSAISVTISAGFAVLPFGDLPEAQFGWEKAIAMADAALYLAKTGGRNRGCGPAAWRVPVPAALAAIERGLGAAVASGLIELATVVGPPQAPVDPGPQPLGA